MTLDDQGQLTSPDTGLTTYTHDAAGNVDVATDARGKTAEYSYDAAGRLTEIEYPDRIVQYGYDTGTYGAGRLTTVSDSQSTLTWSYDAPGRVTERSQTVDTVTLDVDYGFDANGRLTTLTTPSGQVIGYGYGSNGRVTGLTVNGGTLISQVSYRPFGPVTGWQWGNGSTTTRTYDTDGRLTGIVSAGATGYEYFLDGQIKSTTDDYSPTLTEGSTLFTVDTASNQVQSSSGLETRSYSYDAAGNTLSDGARTYTYNDSGRMATATSSGVTTSYVYSGLGERVKKLNANLTRYFAYDEAGHLLGEYDGQGDFIQETVWFGDIPVATLRPDGSGGVDVYYVHTDHLNTPRRVTRPVDDVVVWSWQSTPFGATEADEDPDGDQTTFAYNLRFPGQYRDAETGIYYNYFRTYDPSTGRYLESDPIGLDGGLNTYGYVAVNPVRYFDPDGLRARVRCRLVPVIGRIAQARHCYVEVDPDDGGDTETYGLIGNTGGPLSRSGTIYKNNAFDTGGTSCEWNDEPTVDQCVRDAVGEYANPSNYRFVRGPNSNTFAGTIARKCGLAKPKGFAPGWNDDPAEQKKDTEYLSPVELR